MSLLDYFVGLGSGILVGVVLPIFMWGHKVVDEKKAACDAKLVELIVSLAPQAAKDKKVEDPDKDRLYNVLEISAYCELYFSTSWKTGFATALLFLVAAGLEAFSISIPSPTGSFHLSWLAGAIALIPLLVFLMSLWNLMSSLRSPIERRTL
jgi:hypothetical protein